MSEIRIAWSPGEARIASILDDELIDYAIWRPGKPDGFQDIHVVRITRKTPKLGGAFVELEAGDTGFLTGDSPPEGSLVAAQVSRSAQNGKGLRLRPIKMAVTHTSPALIKRGPTPIDVMALRYPKADIFVDSAWLLTQINRDLRPRLRRVDQAFDSTIDALCEDLDCTEPMIGHGVRAHFHPTPALFAIDLDYPDPDLHPAMTPFQANCAAFAALARAIRVRNISGAIFIDPAGVPSRKRPALVPRLSDVLSRDPERVRVMGVTQLGLIEVARAHGRPPLHDLLSSAHGKAVRLLRDICRALPSNVGHRTLNIRAPATLTYALERDLIACESFSQQTGCILHLSPSDERSSPSWTLS